VRRGRATAAGAVALAAIGAGAVAWAGTHQVSAPQPPSSSRAPLTARGSRPPSAATPLPFSRPVELRIPAIGVRSRVNVVGRATDGSISVPQPGPHYDEAAWFRGSPAPGQTGPAVIVGHVDSRANGPSVFFRLGALRPGDRISVRRKDGRTAAFVVTAVRRYAKSHFPTVAVYGNTRGPALRLITCGGSFDAASGHYRDDVVAFARRG
jgi:sortase (surface protein transpeptidase)